MTNETLARLLARANGREGLEILFCRPLTDTVTLARIWLHAPEPQASSAVQPNDTGYLIQVPDQGYVGLVVDCGQHDLHAFVLPEQRGRGYLSQALRDVILPHLLQSRQTQRITISRNFGRSTFAAAERAALASGFVSVDLGDAAEESVATMEFRPQDWEALPVFEGRTTLPSQQRLQQLHRQLAYHASCLQLISAEVAMHLQDEQMSETINELANQVLALGPTIEDAAWTAARLEGRQLG